MHLVILSSGVTILSSSFVVITVVWHDTSSISMWPFILDTGGEGGNGDMGGVGGGGAP